MKTALLLVLPFSIFIFHFSLVSAQERGMQQVKVNIANKPVVLYQKSYALLIGVSDYSNGLKKLPGVKEDIEAVKDQLEKFGFLVTVVMNPDNTGLTNAFNNFIANYGQEKESRLVFYFAGHGYTRNIYGNEIGYLLPVNCPNPELNPSGFQSNAMPMGQIELFAQQVGSKHALFLFDACFSGAVFAPSRDIPGIISYKTELPVRQFITSGSADETVPDQSIFRRQLLAGLQGEADLNHDQYITGTELGDYLQTTVVNYSRSSLHPQVGKIRDPKLDDGDFVFVVKNNTAKPPDDIIIEPAKTWVQYGKLELMTEIAGSLYIDGENKQTLNANTINTFGNLPAGSHTIKIEGEETVEKEVTITANETANLTMKKRPRQAASTDNEMVFVEGGTFQMGSNDGDSDEKPVHSVTLNNFYIGKTEVTQKQWREVMGSDPPDLKNKGCDQCPVESVSWNDVQDFIAKLNRKTNKTYRLPTEAEWEYAARGGNKSRGYAYSGSANVGDVAWYSENSGSKIHPVAQKQPNELGLYDMSGNVWEWCSDWYVAQYYQNSPASNPQGPSSGSDRVLRGGGWDYDPRNCRSSFRGNDPPADRGDDLGFRLVFVP
ncbi:MAG: SUMF1/EgtB/PvdO family nonheme iron enzyme [Bacteroidetes bacterium]|nr:SUMF1/EgtB/PvdO family nonheme iron enzyme [Bacteroidota bacterium]